MEELKNIVKRYSTLIEAMDQLEIEAHEIKEKYDEFKKTISDEIKEKQSALDEIRKAHNMSMESIEEQSKRVLDAQAIYEKCEKELTNTEKRIKSYITDVDKKILELRKLLQKEDELHVSHSDLIERIAMLEGRLLEIEKGNYIYKEHDEEDIILEEDDEDEEEAEVELYSIRELMNELEEYPLIVVDNHWVNDYCFMVDAIIGNTAYGVNYKDGKIRGTRKANADISTYRLYDGPSRNIIETTARKENLAEFWTNRGFEIRDERPQGYNKYLFVMGTKKQLQPWVNVVTELFDVKGHFYDGYWGTISSK